MGVMKRKSPRKCLEAERFRMRNEVAEPQFLAADMQATEHIAKTTNQIRGHDRDFFVLPSRIKEMRIGAAARWIICS
jgi:hypothetical protein